MSKKHGKWDILYKGQLNIITLQSDHYFMFIHGSV